MGYKGVILTYGKEMVLKKGENVNISAAPSTIQGAEEDVEEWKLGTMKTVEMTEEGDFTGLKFSGAGQDAMRQLAAGEPPSKAIEDATIEICELARLKGVGLLFDAEQDAVQRGIDSWTLDFQRRYNKDAQGKAVVYGTYQAYLRSAPETLAQHLSISQQEGFTLGVKLVRGAYMASDPRELFWAQKEDTDVAYDGITEALVKRRWNNVLKPSPDAATKEVPAVAFVLASHNNESVKKAMAMRREQTEKREEKINMVYAQLLGMADDVSCALVLNAKERSALPYKKRQSDGPKAYKYVTWGSVGECLRYLIRRAEENRDAVTRAKLTRTALRNELGRRLWGRRTGVEQ